MTHRFILSQNSVLEVNSLKKLLMMVTVSDDAKKELIVLMQKQDSSKKYVRVSVSSGGCSGLSYNLDFDNQIVFHYFPFQQNLCF